LVLKHGWIPPEEAKAKDKECQERVERIIKTIEEGNVLRISTMGDWWQDFKKQEGVKG